MGWGVRNQEGVKERERGGETYHICHLTFLFASWMCFYLPLAVSKIRVGVIWSLRSLCSSNFCLCLLRLVVGQLCCFDEVPPKAGRQIGL